MMFRKSTTTGETASEYTVFRAEKLSTNLFVESFCISERAKKEIKKSLFDAVRWTTEKTSVAKLKRYFSGEF